MTQVVMVTMVPFNGATLTENRYDDTNSAYEFDGIDDYLSIKDSESLNFTSSFTWSVWINLKSLDNRPVIISKSSELDNRVGLEVLSDGSICGYFDSHHCSIISNKGDIVVNKNYHVVFIMNNPNDETQIFVNGLVVKTSLENRTLKGNNADLIIGKSELLHEFFFNGQLDNIRIYNRALSESEIQDLYHEGEVCDDRYDEGYEAGKQYCINNPEACGWLGGYTQSDLDNARQEGYNSGCDYCSNGSSNPASISPELNMHIPVLQYQSPFGTMNLWADFEFAGESNGDMLWKLSDFGQK